MLTMFSKYLSLQRKKKILKIGAKNPDAQVTAYTNLPINKSKNSSQSFRNFRVYLNAYHLKTFLRVQNYDKMCKQKFSIVGPRQVFPVEGEIKFNIFWEIPS